MEDVYAGSSEKDFKRYTAVAGRFDKARRILTASNWPMTESPNDMSLMQMFHSILLPYVDTNCLQSTTLGSRHEGILQARRSLEAFEIWKVLVFDCMYHLRVL